MIEILIPQTRRHVLRAVAGALAALPFYRALAQGDLIAASTGQLVEDLALATLRRRPLVLPPGVTRIYRIDLPEGAHLIGAPGGSTLQLAYDGPILANRGPSERITLENIMLDGAGRPINDGFGLVDFKDIAEAVVENCVFRNSTTGLFQHRCGGRVRLCRFHDLTGVAIHDDNCSGMVIDANKIERIGDNGVHHWSVNSHRHDGSRISNNVITDIRNRSGGDGMFGNGVRIAQCGPVTVQHNVIERCAYTAVRNMGCWQAVVADNRCKGLNEKAMYAEFGFRDAIFRNNVISDCAAGISACNYVAPGDGDGALIEGNVISGLRPSHPNREFGPAGGWLHGVHGEGDARMVGNTVVGSPAVAVLAGFFQARHNVTVEDNHLIDNQFGIGFATQDGVEACTIQRNDIRGSKKANIVAMFQEHVISGDVSAPGAASAYKYIEIRDNRIS
jgi:uncharacterized secreted repeat protein (TIGR03808 family)